MTAESKLQEEWALKLAEKERTNTWDSIRDFLTVLEKVKTGKWNWFANSDCKYVELRVDMRTGHCIIKDRNGKRILPEQLAFQKQLNPIEE